MKTCDKCKHYEAGWCNWHKDNKITLPWTLACNIQKIRDHGIARYCLCYVKPKIIDTQKGA